MRKIYTGLDIGSDSIKVLVLEKYNDKLNVLASACVPSLGIKKGLIIDEVSAINCIKRAIKETESKLGTKIDKVVVNVPSNDCEFNIVNGVWHIENEKLVTGKDIHNCLEDALNKSKVDDKEAIAIIPIEYDLDDNKTKEPLNKVGEYLKVRAIVTLVPKKNVHSIVSLLETINIDVIDICFSSLSDYFATKVEDLDRKVVAMVNIGEDITTVSVFNKGIMVKNSILELGSINFEKDICFIYKLERLIAKRLKEDFAVANKRYADVKEEFVTTNKFGEKIVIFQSELAEVIEARIREILEISKKEIKNLTNREISYIIITGGITDMLGFGAVAEEVIGSEASIFNMNVMGIRSNKYSSCFGLIKYFDYKLSLKDQDYSMFNETRINEILGIRKKSDNSNVISKIFERFFE